MELMAAPWSERIILPAKKPCLVSNVDVASVCVEQPFFLVFTVSSHFPTDSSQQG